VSCWVCKYRGIKLPDNHSCGRLCNDFPSCLPSISPEVISGIVNWRLEAGSEREATAAAAGRLALLHDAIQQALASQDDPDQP